MWSSNLPLVKQEKPMVYPSPEPSLYSKPSKLWGQPRGKTGRAASARFTDPSKRNAQSREGAGYLWIRAACQDAEVLFRLLNLFRSFRKMDAGGPI